MLLNKICSNTFSIFSGLIIGRKIQEYRQDYSNFRLSQILRQYYGYTGLIDTDKTRWCARDRNFQSISELENEMINFNKLYRAVSETGIMIGPKTQNKIRDAINEVRNNIFSNMEGTYRRYFKLME